MSFSKNFPKTLFKPDFSHQTSSPSLAQLRHQQNHYYLPTLLYMQTSIFSSLTHCTVLCKIFSPVFLLFYKVKLRFFKNHGLYWSNLPQNSNLGRESFAQKSGVQIKSNQVPTHNLNFEVLTFKKISTLLGIYNFGFSYNIGFLI